MVSNDSDSNITYAAVYYII